MRRRHGARVRRRFGAGGLERRALRNAKEGIAPQLGWRGWGDGGLKGEPEPPGGQGLQT